MIFNHIPFLSASTLGRLCLLLPLGLGVAACDLPPSKSLGDDGNVDDPPAQSLAGRVFVSTSVTENGMPRALVDGQPLSLSFDDASRLGASAGCNSLDAQYEVTGDVLALSDAAMTLIGCEGDLPAQEDWYFDFLQSAPTLELDGDVLVLEGGDTRIEYLDREIATPDLALVGPTWTVDTLIDGDIAGSAFWADPATFVFNADGTVDVFAGCNSGSGTYAVAGSTITFADVAFTEIACDDPDGIITMLEEHVIAVVHGPQPLEWEVSVSRLWLEGGDLGLGLVGSE